MRNLLIDTKPGNSQLEDTRPDNSALLDAKPGNSKMNDPMRLYTVTVNAGQSMGLLLALTYPTGFTVISPKAP